MTTGIQPRKVSGTCFECFTFDDDWTTDDIGDCLCASCGGAFEVDFYRRPLGGRSYFPSARRVDLFEEEER